MKETYYSQNKELRLEYQKQYNHIHRARLDMRYICECGGTFKLCNKSIHIKTKMHQNYKRFLKSSDHIKDQSTCYIVQWSSKSLFAL